MQAPCGVISNRSSSLHREFTGPLSVLFEVYQATWDEKYGALARKSLDWLSRAMLPSGNLPVSVYTRGNRGEEVWADGLQNKTDYPGGMLCHILHDAYRMHPRQWLKDWIITLADSWLYDVPCDEFMHRDQILFPEKDTKEELRTVYQVDANWYMGISTYGLNAILPVITLAYRLSGDLKYAAYLKHQLDLFPQQALDCYRLFSKTAFGAIHNYGYNVPAMMYAVADAAAKQKALSAACKAWKKERARRGYPVFECDRRIYDEKGNLRETLLKNPMNASYSSCRNKNQECLEKNWEFDAARF